MLRSVVIIAVLLSMTLGSGFSVSTDGKLYLGSDAVLAAGEGWLGTWQNRIEIKVDYSKIEETLTDFPVMINISSSSGTNSADLTQVFDELASDDNRTKIAVTTSNGTTQCYVEIESWDTAGEQAWLWVKVPVVYFGSDTILYLYYDSAQPDNTSYVGDTGSTPARNVWKSDFEGVWHLEGDYNATTGEVKDSTSNANHGTGGGGTASQAPIQTASVIGNGQYFNGTSGIDPPDGDNQYIEIPDDNSFTLTTTGQLMYEVWLDFTTTNFYVKEIGDAHYIHTIGKCQSYEEEWILVVGGANGDNPYSIRNYLMNKAGGLGASADTAWQWQAGDKVHVYGWFDTTTKKCYIEVWYPNGYYAYFENTYDDENINPENSNAPLTLGGECEGDSYGQWWEGTFDEFRVMSANQNAAWRQANHFAQADELLYFGEGGSFLQRYEYYYDDNDNAGFGGTIWIGQSFTPQVSHTLKEVRWKIRGDDSPAGNLNCYIYAADGSHKPTGPILSSGSIPCSDVLELQSAQVYSIPMTDVVLTAGQEYCMVLSAPYISNGHFDYRMDTSGEYDGGMWLYSSTSGSSWSTNSVRDMYFGEWGISDTDTPVYMCDLNGDGRVNVLDMIRVGQHQGESGQPGWIPEDVNQDGTVNVLDMVIIGQNWTG